MFKILPTDDNEMHCTIVQYLRKIVSDRLTFILEQTNTQNKVKR